MIHKFMDISCRIPEKTANRFLKNLGLKLNRSDRETQIIAALKKKHRRGKRPPIADVFGFEKRIDCVQYIRYDTGRQLFGKEGIQRATVASLPADLLKAGYILVDAKITQKEGKFNSCAFNLRLHFEPNALDPFQPTLECRTEIQRILMQSWMYVHVWENPDTSCTINAGKAFSPNKAETQDLLTVHMNEQGQFTTNSET